MICSQCNNNIDNDSQFCPFCGNTITRQSGPSAIITIGRNPGNDIVITDPGVSRNHAKISSERGQYNIEDLGSANGTYVNGYKIHIQRLTPTDSIRLGQNVNLSFRDIESAFSKKGKGNYMPPIPSPNPSPSPQSNNRRYSYDEITVGQWIGNFLLMAIPIIGLIVLIVWSSDSSQPSRSNWAKAMIIFNLIYLGFVIMMIVSLLSTGLSFL